MEPNPTEFLREGNGIDNNSISNLSTENLMNSYSTLQIYEFPIKVITIGIVIALIFGIAFGYSLQRKVKLWESGESPSIVLGTPQTITFWICSFIGLTVFFTGSLEILGFAPLKCLLFSLLIAVGSGIPMWRVLKELLTQIAEGKLKELDEFL